MTLTTRCVMLGILLLGTWGARVRLAEPQPATGAESLSKFPALMDAWQGEDSPLDPEVVKTAAVDDYMNRNYRSGEGLIGLYVGYYSSQREGEALHSPMQCLPGTGWAPMKTESTQLTGLDDNRPRTINKLLVEKGIDRMLVLYLVSNREPRHGERVPAQDFPGEGRARVGPYRRRAGADHLSHRSARPRRGSQGVETDASVCRARTAGSTQATVSRMRLPKMVSKGMIAVACAALFVVCSSGCTRDPEQAKRDYVQRGDAFMKDGNLDAAVIEYRNAVQQDARFGEAYRKLSAAYLSRGDAADATRASTAAADLLPDVPEVQIEAGNLLLASGRPDDARARAQRVLTANPANVVARVLLGNAIAGLKEFDSGMKDFEEAIRLNPQETSAYASLGVLQATHGDRQAAERTFRESIELAPKSIPLRLALAQFYWSDRQFDRAEEIMKAAVALVPADARANVALAVFYEFTGRSAESEPYLRAALDAAPSPRIALLLADHYVTAKRTGDAVPLLRRVASDPKLGALASVRLANVSELEGRTDEATRIIDEIVAANPKNGTVLAAKADLLRGRKHLDEALKAADLAIAADPASAQAAFVRGRVLTAKGQFDEARKSFDEVLRLNPRAAAADLELARLRLRGQSPEAATPVSTTAQASPSSLDARLTLARAQVQQRQYRRGAVRPRAAGESRTAGRRAPGATGIAAPPDSGRRRRPCRVRPGDRARPLPDGSPRRPDHARFQVAALFRGAGQAQWAARSRPEQRRVAADRGRSLFVRAQSGPR